VLDIALESVRAAILLGIVVYLWRVGRNRFDRTRNGWSLIVGGFGLLLFGSLLDISDNFAGLNFLVVVGDTGAEAILEKFVGFLGGFVMIAVGLMLWVPSVQRLNLEISERKEAEHALRMARDELELRIEERTRNLAETNETLKREITERKRAEEALQIRKQQFRDFAEASGDWFWETDTEHRFTWFSDRVEEITGVPIAFHIGKSRLELSADQDEGEKWHAHLEILEARRSYRDFRFLRKGHDGRLQHMTSSGVPVFDAEGNFKGYRGTGADITTVVEAEAKAAGAQKQFMAAIESVSDGLALFDADDRMVFCNSRFKAMNPDLAPKIVPGISFEEMLRDNIADGRILDALSDEEAFIRRRMEQHRDPCGPLIQQRRDGHWLELREESMPDGSTFLVNTDITERKAAEEAMLAIMREAEIANRTKSEFLANMSHELRTPLNAIIGFSEIIKDETFGPVGSTKYRDYANDINESGRHLLALINDILDLSKVESGTDDLHEENIEVSEIANAIMKLVVGLAHTGNVELELDVSGDIAVLHADERKVKQILLNLLSNAIKFTPDGGKVTLKIWSRAESGYVFQVTDTGIGIAFEDIPRALTPFQQIDSGLNRIHEGTGLGLPLAKSLVEMHGGYLDLQSEVGVGTTVTVRFPAERIVPSPYVTKAIGAGDRKAG
jgi:PAS domain S-box-containing protein